MHLVRKIPDGWCELLLGSVCDMRSSRSGIHVFPVLFLSGPRPDRPTNVTVRRTKNGYLHITWTPPKNTTVPVYYYVVTTSTSKGPFTRTVALSVSVTIKI